MYTTELAISFILILIAIYLAVRHAMGKKHAVNILFSVTCITTALFFGVNGIIAWSDAIPAIALLRIGILTLGLIIIQLSFCFTLLYPRWERLPSIMSIVLSQAPGIIIIIMLFIKTELAVRGVISERMLTHIDTLYEAAIGGYAAAGIVYLLYKSKNLKNVSFQSQIRMLALGYAACAMVMLVFIYGLPKIFFVSYFTFSGISASSLLWMIIINYVLVHEKTLDLVKFYREVFFWIIFFMVLVAPSYLILRLGRTEITSGNPIPVEGIAVMIFLYLFLSYRFLKPALQKFMTRRDTKFEAAANEFFGKIAQITSEEKGESFWDLFLENSILPLETKFSIDAASLYIVTAEGKYELGYSFGTKLNLGEITPGNDIYECLQEYGRLVHVSFFYVDEKLGKYMSVREIMERAGIAVMIPFFSQERMLIGTLLLGTHKKGVYYPQELLGFFETYRIQLELSMGNALMLEEVKRLQIKEHENLVIRSIKKRLVPAELSTINGIRISSLFVDNSDMGGDYLDTVVLGKNSVGFFMCDAADAGVESGILLLELYSVLHNQPEKMDTPDKMLNAMNWVIATSRYTNRYVPALYCTYDSNTKEISLAGAAFNPLVLYNIKKDEFVEFDAKGIPLGLEKNYSYEMKKMKIAGEVVGFMYSDGITTAVNKNGLAYSTGRIKDIIRLNKEDTPAILARKIYKDFIAFTEGVEMKTDASLLIFKISQ